MGRAKPLSIIFCLGGWLSWVREWGGPEVQLSGPKRLPLAVLKVAEISHLGVDKAVSSPVHHRCPRTSLCEGVASFQILSFYIGSEPRAFVAVRVQPCSYVGAGMADLAAAAVRIVLAIVRSMRSLGKARSTPASV